MKQFIAERKGQRGYVIDVLNEVALFLPWNTGTEELVIVTELVKVEDKK